VLRGIFGAKGDDVTREWRKLYREEFNYLYVIKYYSGEKSKRL
jgi:hypothetical protein